MLKDLLTHIATSHQYLVYALIVVLGFLEGPFLSVICGFLLSLGFFAFIPLYASLMLGDILGDALWYFLGFKYGHSFVVKHGKRFGLEERMIEKVKLLFHRHKNPILFLSKVTNGFGFSLVTLFTAGMSKIPFFEYLAVNTLGQFIWSGVLIWVGYFFANLYMSVSNIAFRVFITIVFVLMAFLVMQYRKYIKKSLEDTP